VYCGQAVGRSGRFGMPSLLVRPHAQPDRGRLVLRYFLQQIKRKR
jgi:hypothetical protein